MKIMVYYFDLPRHVANDLKLKCDAKKEELQKSYSGINILVLPSHTGTGDRVEVVDLSPNYPPAVYGDVAGARVYPSYDQVCYTFGGVDGGYTGYTKFEGQATDISFGTSGKIATK